MHVLAKSIGDFLQQKSTDITLSGMTK